MVTKKKSTVVDKNDSQLRQVEEIMERSHQHGPVDVHAPLEKKTNNKELLARLLEIERTIMERAYIKGIITKD